MIDPRILGARVAPPPPGAPTMPRPAATQSSRLADSHALELKHPVMDQQRGSCLMNATGAGLVSMSEHPWRPSISAGYFDLRRYSGFSPGEDSGGYLEQTLQMLREVGVGSLALHPDEWDEGWAEEPSRRYYEQARDHRVLNHYRVLDVPSMELALATGFPVIICLKVTETFDDARNDGVFRHPGRQVLGGHAMLAYGYSRESQTIHVLQSWGEWGGEVYWHPDMGRGSLAIPYDLFPRAALVYDAAAISKFDVEAGS